jgi:PAS domain S-box-containing protein
LSNKVGSIKFTNEQLLKKYQDAMANASMGFSHLDLASGKIHWDENWRKLYELPEGKFEGSLEEWFQFLHADDQERVQAYFQQFLQSDAKIDIFYRIVLKSGGVKRIRASGARIMTNGVLTGFEGVCWEDISPMLLQYDVKNSNNFTNSVLNTIPDPVFVKNDRHEVIYANEQYEKFVGMKKETFVGRSDYEFFPKELADRFWKQDQDVFEAQAPVEDEQVVVDGAGRSRLVLTKKTPLSVSDHEKILVGIVRDITELKQIQASLLAQSKMAALGEMAAGIAHEINNPLAIIHGKALLLKDKSTDERVIAGLDMIEQNCVRIEKIVRSLKSVSRNSSSDPFEEVSVISLVEEAFVIAKERFREKRLDLNVTIEKGITEFDRTRARSAEIVQVLVNLLNNSFDAIQESGGWARLGVSLDNGKFLIEVVDSGPKISPDVAGRMMEPFFTTKSSGKGTGLGLSVSRQFIENHDSKLTYDPTSANTRIYFKLVKL